MTALQPDDATLALVIRRRIRATPERLFAAWTEPDQLRSWWGPDKVRCTEAQVDLRVGGSYRIANAFPDGKVLWISGRFEQVQPPERLVYTWTVEPGDGPPERVSVEFRGRGEATDVTIVHERIASADIRDRHELGWTGCLDGLSAWLALG